jgi:hypothetical protein
VSLVSQETQPARCSSLQSDGWGFGSRWSPSFRCTALRRLRESARLQQDTIWMLSLTSRRLCWSTTPQQPCVSIMSQRESARRTAGNPRVVSCAFCVSGATDNRVPVRLPGQPQTHKCLPLSPCRRCWTSKPPATLVSLSLEPSSPALPLATS